MQKNTPWPKLDYSAWSDTYKTLHLWTQIVGKVRLKTMPWLNHSWHTTLYISPRGFTTGSIPYEGGLFTLDFDFEDHCLTLSSTFHPTVRIPLQGHSVASFFEALMEQLKNIGVDVEIHDRPNEMEDNTPFHQNTQTNTYIPEHARNFWRATVLVNNVFVKFRSGFMGKCSPVHLFWGAFDLAVTRFSGEPAPLHSGGMPNMPLSVMQEAYSQEVSSAGFWPGGDAFPKAIFYSYCYPSPEDFKSQNVLPKEAFWEDSLGEYVLLYDDVISTADPAATLMQFLQTTYDAAAETGNWRRDFLEKN